MTLREILDRRKTAEDASKTLMSGRPEMPELRLSYPPEWGVPGKRLAASVVERGNVGVVVNLQSIAPSEVPVLIAWFHELGIDRPKDAAQQ